jgi:hypothetical protein
MIVDNTNKLMKWQDAENEDYGLKEIFTMHSLTQTTPNNVKE